MDTRQRMVINRAQALTRSIGVFGGRICELADKRTVTVQSLRDGGLSWAEIARHLDMSPQAVQKIANRRVAA